MSGEGLGAAGAAGVAGGAERLARLLAGAKRILLFTGAGVSTGSGIPDFRGPGGVWERRRPVYYDEFLASEAARVEHWDYKSEGWEAFRDARPNAAHRACVAVERAGRLLMLVTQNIDGLHARAGTSRERLVELHGTNLEVECLGCGARSDPERAFAAFRAERRAPRCGCGGLLKPATVSFGQALPVEALGRAFAAAAAADLVVALGSTLSVAPAADIPLEAVAHGAAYAIVNRGPTAHDGLRGVTLRVEGDVGDVFPGAVRAAYGAAQS